jgi:hypothetical protein
MINYFTKLKNRNIIVKDTRSNKLYSIYDTEWFSVYWYSDYWYESILNFCGIFPFVIIFEPKLNGKQPDLIPMTRAEFCKYMEIVVYDK